MKTSARNTTTKKRGKTLRLRRTPLKESELPPEVREFRQKFREWEESYQSPARRMTYIRKICARIAKAYQPEKIILFGSHAYGKPTPESDVDLLIVMNFEGRPIEQTLKIHRELEIVTPVDLLVRTPEDVKKRVAEGDMFMRQVVEHGKVMYEA